MWAQQQYSLQLAQWQQVSGGETTTVTFATIRGLRSAASQFYAWDMQVANPGLVSRDAGSRPVIGAGCCPTDEYGYTLMSGGMSRRLGEESKPATALLARHVAWIDRHLDASYQSAKTQVQHQSCCRAALVNVIAWLAWLRAMEVFSLRWSDVEVIDPENGIAYEFPPNVGALLLRLLEATKSDRTRTADMIIAYTTFSGLSPSIWFHRLRYSLGINDWTFNDSFIFVHLDGSPWTSHFFRVTYLLPFLTEQQLEGDAYLVAFDGSPGNTLYDKFWSMHCYRSGGRSSVSTARPTCKRPATPQEIAEHGHWRQSRRHMDMPTLYLQWTLADHLAITMLCM